MNKLTSLVLMLAALIALAPPSCHAMNATRAERCVFIDLKGLKGRELIPLLDKFAADAGLVENKSDPAAPRYALVPSLAIIEAEIAYEIGMGRFGAALSLFRFDNARNTGLPEQFDDFVKGTIAAKYKVTACQPEQFPTVYR
ncbi:MAG: hypothetical protein ACT4NL_14570 [Pseudomarimonas sp.]